MKIRIWFGSGGILAFATLILSIWPFTTLKTRQRMAQVWAGYNRRILAIFCGLRDYIEGLEQLPPPPFILFSKHQSAWETITFHHIFPRFVLVLKHSLLYIPFFGWALLATGQIAINRSKGMDALRKMRQQGITHFKQGTSLVIFPEGTRMAPGQIGHYNGGGIALALEAEVPIVPVAHNAGLFWPRRTFFKKPGLIHVKIGAPIYTSGMSPSDRKKILQIAQDRIESMMDEIEIERQKRADSYF
ncbi:MAG: 1-acyl-sn-glycerol-3-phosphate acyltransferase [Magnetococcus sp. DMHC-6]